MLRRWNLMVLLGVLCAFGFQGAPSGVYYHFFDARPGGAYDNYHAMMYTTVFLGYPPVQKTMKLSEKGYERRYNGEMGTYGYVCNLEFFPGNGQPLQPLWVSVIDVNLGSVVDTFYPQPIELP